MPGILSVRRRCRRWISPVVILACLVICPAVSDAQEINDCNAADQFLKKTIEQANHYRHAGECATLKIEGNRTVGCGLLFNDAEGPATANVAYLAWAGCAAGLVAIGCWLGSAAALTCLAVVGLMNLFCRLQ